MFFQRTIMTIRWFFHIFPMKLGRFGGIPVLPQLHFKQMCELRKQMLWNLQWCGPVRANWWLFECWDGHWKACLQEETLKHNEILRGEPIPDQIWLEYWASPWNSACFLLLSLYLKKTSGNRPIKPNCHVPYLERVGRNVLSSSWLKDVGPAGSSCQPAARWTWQFYIHLPIIRYDANQIHILPWLLSLLPLFFRVYQILSWL